MANFSVFAISSKFTLRVVAIVILLLFVHSEFVTYWILPLTWMNPPNCPSPQCKKLLLVSDPQIIGPEWHGLTFMDVIAIWDSDRYIRRTFQSALSYLRPDMVIFLGDLMDQGHLASEPEFRSYMRRLKNVFELPSYLDESKVIISPGDNDIGGVDDILVPENVRRFDRMFNQSEESTLTEFIEFCKVNLMTATLQSSKFINGDLIRVVLSHVPLIPKENFFLKEVVKKIRPHLIFSGHFHTSSHYATYETDVWSHRHKGILPADNVPKMYKFHEGLIHEIIVPTCSYRMGVSNMGYGAAFIDTKQKMVYYNVLWLPRRFIQLSIYLVMVSPLAVVFFMWLCRRIRGRNRQKRYSRSFDRLYASP